MRAIHILIFFIIIIVNGCTTIEVAKEVTKATNSVKKTGKKDKEGTKTTSLEMERIIFSLEDQLWWMKRPLGATS